MTNLQYTSPCKGCTDRYVGCHARCSQYKGWRTEFDRIKAKERQFCESLGVTCMSIEDAKRRIRRV